MSGGRAPAHRVEIVCDTDLALLLGPVLAGESPALLRRVLQHALAELALPLPVGVDLTLGDDDLLLRLNRQFRGRDETTDVLSFPLWDDAELTQIREGRRPVGAAPGEPVPLGDIVINAAEAARAAERYGHSTERELGFLAVHGLLHLLGHDHDRPEREEAMQALTERLLAGVGLRRAQDGD